MKHYGDDRYENHVNRTTVALGNKEGTIHIMEDLSRSGSDEADVNDEDTTSNMVSGTIHELTNLTIILPSTSTCSAIDCEMENSKFMLACSKCKKLTPNFSIYV